MIAVERWRQAHAPRSRATLCWRTALRAPVALCAVSATLIACSFDTDSLYADTAASDGSGGSSNGASDGPPAETDAAAPFVPWVPGIVDADFTDSCTECAQQNCLYERDVCLADPRCAELLLCKSHCRDPDCQIRCEEPRFLADRECELGCTNDTSLSFIERETCEADCWEGRFAFDALSWCLAPWVVDGCGTECNFGNNFDCAGKYDWSVPDSMSPRQLRITIRHLVPYGDQTPGLPGIQVCWGQCTRVGASTTANGWLDLNGAGVALELRGDVPPYPKRTQMFLGRRVLRSQSFIQYVRLRNRAGAAVTDDSTGVWGWVHDCLGMSTGQSEVHLDGYDSDSDPSYGGALSGGLSFTGPYIIDDVIPDADEGYIVATDPQSGEERGRTGIQVTAGWDTGTAIYPPTKLDSP